MKKFVLVFAFFTLCTLAYGQQLKCYSCDGLSNNNNKDCKTLDEKSTATCGKALAPLENYCFKIAYKDKTTGKENVYRGCDLVSNKDTNQKCNEKLSAANTNYNLVSCDACNTELCNSSSRSGITFLTILSAFVMYFITSQF